VRQKWRCKREDYLIDEEEFVKTKSLIRSNVLKIEFMRKFSNKNGYKFFFVWGIEEIE